MKNIDDSWNDSWRQAVLSIALDHKQRLPDWITDRATETSCLETVTDAVCDELNATLAQEQDEIAEIVAEYWSIL